MATGFNTQVSNGKYRLQFETDNREYYLLMQETARRCVDGKPVTNADRIRNINDEELAIHLNVGWECSLCKEQIWINNKFSLGDCDMNCVGHCLEWLKKPAEEADNG